MEREVTRRGHNRRGVTLIEMLIVVVIMGIVAAIALPRIDLTRIRVDTAMQTAGTTLLAAQRFAVTSGHDVIVGFDQVNGLMRVLHDADNNGTAGAGERVRNYDLGDQVVFGLGGAVPHPIGGNAVNFTQTRDGLFAVTFHRSGSASEFGGVYLTSGRAALAPGRSKDTRVLQIERSTGRASWFRYTGSAWIQGF